MSFLSNMKAVGVVVLTVIGITRGLCLKVCFCLNVSTVNCSWASLRTFSSDSGLLTSLDLSHNLISNINDSIFLNQTSLQYVDISYNNVHYIPSTTFRSARALVWLSLSGNELRQLPNRFLESVSLKVLVLSQCDLNHISVSAFQEVPALKLLDLSHNNLQFTSLSYFSSSYLEYLDVSFNKIVSVDVFSEPSQLLSLNLSYNLLTTLHRHTLMFLRNTVTTSSLQGNPWKCDCGLYRTYRWCAVERVDIDIVCQSGPQVFLGHSWQMFDKTGWCHMTDSFYTMSRAQMLDISQYAPLEMLTSGVSLVLIMLALVLWFLVTRQLGYRDPKKGSEAKEVCTPIYTV